MEAGRSARFPAGIYEGSRSSSCPIAAGRDPASSPSVAQGGETDGAYAITGDSTPTIFTIGHSTRTFEEFAALLQMGGIRTVVDIRSIRRSRTNPEYNEDRLPETLASRQIGHAVIEELGGRRKKSPDVPPEVNGFWTNRSFHNYADHALSDDFESGMKQLASLSGDRNVAIMCAEAVWWRCHRRIVADYLLARGRKVMHIVSASGPTKAKMTPAAREQDGKLVYPA